MQKISIYSSITSKFPIEERIASIKEAGFDAVCLDFEKNLEKKGDFMDKSAVACRIVRI